MSRPQRYRFYAAETGITYEYFFAGCRTVVRPEGEGPGRDFTFVVIAGRSLPLTLTIFVADRGLAAWHQAHGRELDSSEQYAAAKMRLFRALDTLARVGDEALGLVVNETNIDELLEPLDLA